MYSNWRAYEAAATALLIGSLAAVSALFCCLTLTAVLLTECLHPAKEKNNTITNSRKLFIHSFNLMLFITYPRESKYP
jgi:hypothetical protein